MFIDEKYRKIRFLKRLEKIWEYSSGRVRSQNAINEYDRPLYLTWESHQVNKAILRGFYVRRGDGSLGCVHLTLLWSKRGREPFGNLAQVGEKGKCDSEIPSALLEVM